MLLPLLLSLTLPYLTLSSPQPLSPKASTSWPGWPHLKNLFIFGDSYTTTGFNPNSTQPNPSNPLGNPAYPGYTSSNGPNWVDFITTTYNASTLYTYNLAYGGATVDSALVTPYEPTVVSMKSQIEDEFLPLYSHKNNKQSPSPAPQNSVTWEANDTLFAFWIGINDVGNSWYLSNSTTITSAIFTLYARLLDDLYDAGARNFLFVNVPPVNRAPLITAQNDGGYATEHEGVVIADWNARLGNLTRAFEGRRKGVRTFVFDANALFVKVLSNPASVEETRGYKNTTAFCAAYKNGTPSWYTKDPSCEYPVNEYLWLNELHPTFPMHNATAKAIVEFLPKGDKQ